MKKLRKLVFKKQSPSQNVPPKKKKKLGASIKRLVLEQPRLYDTPSQKMKQNKANKQKIYLRTRETKTNFPIAKTVIKTIILANVRR